MPAYPQWQLWSIDQNGDADGEVHHVDFETGHQNDTNGKASLISSADDGEAWAIQSCGTPMRWDSSTQKWVDTESTFTQVAVSTGGLQWGLVPSINAPQVLIHRESPADTWKFVASTPESTNLIQIATNSAGDLVCVTSDNKAFSVCGVWLSPNESWACCREDGIAYELDLYALAQCPKSPASVLCEKKARYRRAGPSAGHAFSFLCASLAPQASRRRSPSSTRPPQ